MTTSSLTVLQRAYLAARLDLEDSQQRGDTPSKESYVDAVLGLLDALKEHELHREILEVTSEVTTDRDVVGPFRVELAHRRARAGIALMNRSVVVAALHVLRTDLKGLRGAALKSATSEVAAIEQDMERVLAAQPPTPAQPVVARRFVHAKFGVGDEIGGDDQNVRPRFEDGTERLIPRSKVTEV
jgi:hypothetical protein